MITAPEEQQLRSLIQSPKMASNPISRFLVAVNTAAGGLDISFTLTDATGIEGIDLLRSAVVDANVAALIQHWSAREQGFNYTDTGTTIQQNDAVFYWLRLTPVGTTGTARLIGPQSSSVNPDLTAPDAVTVISASHDAVSNGSVPVSVNVQGLGNNSVRIYVTGYRGNSGAVAVASAGSSPVQFSLQATGETVALYAVAVSDAGKESAVSPSVPLTLSGGKTAPATPNAPKVVQFAGGNQLTWASSAESWVTGYQVLRGMRTGGGTTILATVPATTSASVTYTDAAGLNGDFGYYIVATSASGNSAQSAQGFPPVTFSSQQLPANVSGNVTNTAKIDSVSVNGYALIRVYGPGGVGTAYTYYRGSASYTRPNGTISGNQYKTQYAIVYDSVNFVFLAYLMTNYPATLPDTYELVGYHTTVSTGQASGSGATATAVLGSAGTVVQVNVTNSGSGYDNAEVDFSGGGGSGATAHVNISTFTHSISSITVDNGGTGYTSAPTVTIVSLAPGQTTGGGGSSTIFAGGARYASDPQYVNG